VKNNGTELRQTVSEKIINVINNNNYLPKERAELGFYLGSIGDNIRFTNMGDYIIPPTVEVEYLSNIKVAKYPVTNAEFALFIKDNGYDTQKEHWNTGRFDSDTISHIIEFWTNVRINFQSKSFVEFCHKHKQTFNKDQFAGLAWFLQMSDDEVKNILTELYHKDKYSQPLLWDNQEYNNPAQPVVGVGYYEVLAYCSWLSSKTNKQYRLLTKEEWETMAKTNTQKYAFGNSLNNTICNTFESELKMILPVGIIKENCTSDGVYDVNGNIFEWTSSILRNNENPINIQYIVKGGSWIQNKERATSEYIGRAKTWCRNLDVGFRVCLDESN
jgi:formylglycine-generating enzyme required for sulfatase activity